MMRVTIVVLLFLLSCTGKTIQSKISDADRIEVIDNDSGFSYTDTSAMVVQGFKEVFDGQPVSTECTSQGKILFKRGEETKLQVGYYKDATECAFLIVEEGSKKTGYRLTPNTLMYLGVYFQKKKQKHIGRNN
jgi:hypothetical protein